MRRLTIIMIVLACVALFTTQAFADAQADFKAANDLYHNDKPADAAKRYQALIDSGIHDVDLYYNAATAFLRAGDLGHAALYFERALSIDPDCEPCAFNYEKLKQKQKDRVIEAENETAPTEGVGSILSSIPTGALKVVFLSVWLVLVVLLLILRYLKTERARFSVLITAASMFLFVVVLAGMIHVKSSDEKTVIRAVVMSEEIEVKKGPNVNFDTAFSVHQGLVVRIGESSEDWRQIFLENGLHGFVPAKDLSVI